MEISDVRVLWTGHLFAIYRPARLTIDRERRRAGTRRRDAGPHGRCAQRVTPRRIINTR
jgi:hypothetical protein